MESQVRLFSGTNTQYLASAIAESYGVPLGKVEVRRFSDGEMCPVILESIRGDYVFLVQSTIAPTDNLFELLLLIDSARRASAEYITAVIPYFGFARQDRKDKPRVPIAAKLIANLLTAAGANRIMTMDLHAPQIQGFFDIPVDHLESSTIFIPYIKSLDLHDVTFAAPDVGGVNRARSYAIHFNKEMVICDKYRKRPNEISAMTVIGDVTGRNVIICDDIIDTGNTLANASDLMLSKGAKSVRALITHPVLSGKAYENIENSSLTEVVVCDTIPLKKTSPKIKVLSVAELFATAIRNMYEHKSITSLFLNN
ncbi:MAG: ribose-phosphate pyrophosphokinase [Chitinophagales bacterium]|jgi:ribose-phosphate pyrophosphokinase|nr:ribose-phosphate pyrophosphokinase [Chitinophagaceae bacterium]MBP9883674.1 ribose-phosphate pyrophosphokinase [Chitinophagales bacterium]